MATTLTATINSLSLNDSKPNVNLDEKVETGIDLTLKDVLQLLEANCEEYVRAKGNSKIVNILIDNCGKGNGYLSLVLKLCVQFDEVDRPDFRFVLKIPLPNAMSSMIEDDNGGKEVEPEQKLKDEEVKEVNIL